MTRFHETNTRSVIKTVSYRAANITLDSIVVYLLTHRVQLTAGLVVITNITSSLLYFVSERGWNGVGWGRTTKR